MRTHEVENAHNSHSEQAVRELDDGGLGSGIPMFATAGTGASVQVSAKALEEASKLLGENTSSSKQVRLGLYRICIL